MTEVLLVENDEQPKEFPNKESFKKRRGWGLPGGRMRPGEEPEYTVWREYGQETGFDVTVPDRRIRTVENRGDHQVIFFYVEIVGGEKNISEEGILDCRWWPLNALPEEIYPSHRRNIFKIRESLKRIKCRPRRII